MKNIATLMSGEMGKNNGYVIKENNVMLWIDMSGYNGAENIKILTKYIEKVEDIKGIKLKLGGWLEGMAFNQAYDDTEYVSTFDNKWKSRTKLEKEQMELILNRILKWKYVEVIERLYVKQKKNNENKDYSIKDKYIYDGKT